MILVSFCASPVRLFLKASGSLFSCLISLVAHYRLSAEWPCDATNTLPVIFCSHADHRRSISWLSDKHRLFWSLNSS